VSTYGLAIGTWLNSRWFQGTIDEFRLYSRVLTREEIAALVPPRLPSSTPVLAYDLENLTADGKMKDLRGNGNHGTVFGTTDSEGKVGRARSFNGTGDKIVVPSFAGFGGAGSAVSVEAWVNPTSLGAALAIVGQRQGGVLLDIEPSGRLNFWANTNNQQQDCDSTIPTGTFTHIAVTYDDSTGNLKF